MMMEWPAVFSIRENFRQTSRLDGFRESETVGIFLTAQNFGPISISEKFFFQIVYQDIPFGDKYPLVNIFVGKLFIKTYNLATNLHW